MGRTSNARQRLIGAAFGLIWEHSYGAVTIEAICERARVKKGSFYYFFDSKADLAAAAIEAWWIQRQTIIQEIFQPEVPPLDRIQKYVDFVSQRQLTYYETNGQILGCPLFSLGSEICTQDEGIRARIHEILRSLTGCFEKAIREAQLLGQVEGKDAAAKARTLFSCYEGTLTLARLENNPEPLRYLSSEMLAFLGVRPALALA